MLAKIYDTSLWEYIQNPWVRWLSLDKLSIKELNYKMINYDEITNKWKINFSNLPLETTSIYWWEYVYIINLIYKKQKEKNIINNKILKQIEIPLINVLKQMEIDWVFIDIDILKWIWTLLEKEIKNLEKSIFDYVWEEFNIKSPKQVWNILFEKLALPKGKKTKTWYSVSADILWELAHEYSVAQKIVDYRHYNKLLSTYIEWLINLTDENSLVHTNYNSTVTSTGRLSSTKPNLQNIPHSHWIAWEIRSAFISRFKWWKIIAFDYSQVEIRLLAIMSGDKNLIDAFKKWIDIHHKTAEFIFPWKTITANERKIAKAVNFWVIYWISSFWLSKMIWISIKDAKIYIDKFYESYPQVRIFLDEIINWCEKNKYVETIFWRKRYINWINDLNKLIKSSAEREAINMPIQWTSADIIKISMIRIYDFLTSPQPSSIWKGVIQLKSKMIMQVHDELVFDVFKSEESILKQNVLKIMQEVLKDKQIILKAHIWEGYNWRDCK